MSTTYRPMSAGARRLLPWATAAVAAVIFTMDSFTPPDCVVSGLYVVVVLMADLCFGPRSLRLIVAGCAGLTILAQILGHLLRPVTDQITYIGLINTAVSLVTIGLAYYLVMRGRADAEALLEARADLSHVSRVTTMGELTASIAHEVNQPIAGVVANAGACARWLAGDAPDIERARAAAARIVRDGTRAADIIAHIRLIFTKGGQQRRWVDLSISPVRRSS
jgi:signal transduction histidine kinase